MCTAVHSRGMGSDLVILPDGARSVDAFQVAEAVFICSVNNKGTVSGIEAANVATCSSVYSSLPSPSIIHPVLQGLQLIKRGVCIFKSLRMALISVILPGILGPGLSVTSQLVYNNTVKVWVVCSLRCTATLINGWRSLWGKNWEKCYYTLWKLIKGNLN